VCQGFPQWQSAWNHITFAVKVLPYNGLSTLFISAGHWWLTHVILATQEAEIRRTPIGSQQANNLSLEEWFMW
jgi:predicted alpha-1,6-mannanase (GH76 family)